MTSYQGSERQAANDASKLDADNDHLEWDRAEDGLLQTWDRTEDELAVMAEILGRTREACRQRYYEVRTGRKAIKTRTRVVIQARVTRVSGESAAASAYHYERWTDSEEWNADWYR